MQAQQHEIAIYGNSDRIFIIKMIERNLVSGQGIEMKWDFCHSMTHTDIHIWTIKK